LNVEIWGDRCARDLCVILDHCERIGTEEELKKRIENMPEHYADQCGPNCLHDPNFAHSYTPLNISAPFYQGLKEIIKHLVEKVPKIWKSRGVGKLTGLHALIVRRVPKGMFFKRAYPARVAIAIGEYSCGPQFFKDMLESYGLKLSPWALTKLIRRFTQRERDHLRKASPRVRMRITQLKKGKRKRAHLFQAIPKRPATKLRLAQKTQKGPQGISKRSAHSCKPRKCSYCSGPGHTRKTCPQRLCTPPATGPGILR
jgi:hypothetical protein